MIHNFIELSIAVKYVSQFAYSDSCYSSDSWLVTFMSSAFMKHKLLGVPEILHSFPLRSSSSPRNGLAITLQFTIAKV